MRLSIPLSRRYCQSGKRFYIVYHTVFVSLQFFIERNRLFDTSVGRQNSVSAKIVRRHLISSSTVHWKSAAIFVLPLRCNSLIVLFEGIFGLCSSWVHLLPFHWWFWASSLHCSAVMSSSRWRSSFLMAYLGPALPLWCTSLGAFSSVYRTSLKWWKRSLDHTLPSISFAIASTSWRRSTSVCWRWKLVFGKPF